MKGFFKINNNQTEVEIFGESWARGSELNAKIIFSGEADTRVALICALALVDKKKFKAKDEKAFKILKESTVDVSPETKEIDFQYNLKLSDPISEKTKSLYFIVANSEQLFDGGHLELEITAQPLFLGFLKIFENFFRFKVKEAKNKKDWVDYKMIGPGTKELSAIDQLNLQMKEDDGKLYLNYIFKLKKLKYELGDVKASSEKSEIEDHIPLDRFHLIGDSLDQNKVMNKIQEVLDQVKRKTRRFGAREEHL